MGALRDLRTGLRAPLADLHRVGRSPDCALVVEGGFASREHAIVSWSGERWEVRDLGSHNGTTVDGARLPPGVRVPLAKGARLGFGGEETHELSDDRPPEPLARAADGSWREGEGGLLELSIDGRAAVVIRDARGGWRLEQEDAVRPVHTGEQLADGLTLLLPDDLSPTRPRTADEEPVARFKVSLDEEHVSLTVFEGRRPCDLGARSHTYLLLTLGRARLADVDRADLPDEERGWVDTATLARGLRTDLRYLNVLVHRARRQAIEAGLACAHQLVERRDPARQIRLGLARVEVVR
jgi:hypothetical protein